MPPPRFSTFGLLAAALIMPAVAWAEDPPAEDPAVTAAKAQKAIYDAETAAWTAKKAKTEAEASATSAKFGPLASYTNAGGVDVGANSGKLEVTLLASEATQKSAGKIVTALCSQLSKAPKSACGDSGVGPDRLWIFPDSAMASFDTYDAFTLQLRSIRAQLLRVKDMQPVPIAAGGGGGAISAGTFALAGAATALSVIGNVLRSEYKVSGIEVAQTDALLLKAFFTEARVQHLKPALFAPSLYPERLDLATNSALVELGQVGDVRDTVAHNADALRARLAAQPKDKPAIDPVLTQMDQAVSRFDAFATKQGTPDDKGVVPLAVVARQAALAQSITNDSFILFLKGEAAGGSAYAKKNFWTFLGELPFSVSGGSLVSYTLVKGTAGQVVAAGIIPQTKPFMKLNAATRHFAGPSAR